MSSTLRSWRRRTGVLVAAASLTALTLTALPASGQAAVVRHQNPLSLLLAGLHVTLPCGEPAAGQAACSALVDDDARPYATTTGPAGLTPAQLRAAYKLPTITAAPIVAIVDAYDDPNLEADLAVYRSQFGLPACTTAAGCFLKVNQAGATSPLPSADAGWAEEESLDVDAVSAACPTCRILVVEASSSSMTDLGTAVNTAASYGPASISNSYGGSESTSSASYSATYYNHPGIAVTVSAGDAGYGVEFPASSQYVTAVGGTSLKAASNARGWTETVWGSYFGQGTGSGCSARIAKPTWQATGIGGCTKRSVADVSAVADPATGLAVYDSYGGAKGWVQVGGTSLASPVIAATYALAGNTGPGAATAVPAALSYSHTGNLNDVTSGTNGLCFGYSANACAARAGYDGPTGNGTPNGVGAF